MKETPERGDSTPENLRPAIKALATTLDTDVWKCGEATEYLAYAALHPSVTPMKTLTEYEQPLSVLKQLVGRNAAHEFDSMLQKRTEPAIFRAYLNLFRRGVEFFTTQQFAELLKIAQANEAELEERPVEWAKFQATEMISGQRHKVESWVISVCDGRELGPVPADREKFLDYCRRTDWRAPKLIHMQPSGNTPYDPMQAWSREDEAQTERLRDSLAKDFLLFVEIHLKKIGGAAEIKLAQEAPSSPIPPVSRAPKPITPIRGGHRVSPRPTNKPLLNYPHQFPKELIPRANVIIHDGLQKHTSPDQILDLCRYVIGELAPDLLKLFSIRRLEPHDVLEQVSELARYLLISNCSNDNRRYALQLESRQSPEWVELSRALADVPGSTQKPVPSQSVEIDAPEVDAAMWEKIKIVITSDKQLQIFRDGKAHDALNYVEFGLEDKRSKKPNTAWKLLTLFARKSGVINSAEGHANYWPRLEKQVQALRKALREHFRLSSDPIPFVSKTGYQARFKIECHPSIDD